MSNELFIVIMCGQLDDLTKRLAVVGASLQIVRFVQIFCKVIIVVAEVEVNSKTV
jgi:hypothetical protein